ncbi:hypothetical protein G5I_13229 [Acromyrmex echinatior]|uniref:Uncharacterized protein n=1 Tax=Acromyrmex echinatior TaxID=103372 RepID=F4X4G8_ACREC|nr:hypothetical protein G5I_13229 [Acromyrmex echinatior]
MATLIVWVERFENTRVAMPSWLLEMVERCTLLNYHALAREDESESMLEKRNKIRKRHRGTSLGITRIPEIGREGRSSVRMQQKAQ